MANLNKVMLIGRLTRDPEVRTFGSGGKVAAFGFAVNNKKKNQATGQWEDEAVFIDVKAFNRETGRKLADLVEQYLKKGHQFYLEGHLVFEQWDDKQTGAKRSVLKVILDDFQFLEPRQDGAPGEGGSKFQRSQPATQQAKRPQASEHFDEPEPHAAGGGGEEGEIPF